VREENNFRINVRVGVCICGQFIFVSQSSLSCPVGDGFFGGTTVQRLSSNGRFNETIGLQSALEVRFSGSGSGRGFCQGENPADTVVGV